MAERLQQEQNDVIVKMKTLLEADTLSNFVDSGLDICNKVFPGKEGLFADGACEQWERLSCVPRLPAETDTGCSLSVRLRQLLTASNGVVQQVLAAVAALAPHSM